jgi:hypothetical protein
MSIESTEKRWRRLIAEQERSGLNVREFAEARGLSPWSLYGWRSRLGRAGRGGRKSGRGGGRRREKVEELVAVEIVGGEAADRGPSGGEFELELGEGVLVRIPRGFDETELRRLVSAVRSSC